MKFFTKNLSTLHRTVLFIIASISSLILLLFNDLVLHIPLRVFDHMVLPIFILGLCGAFVRGVGFNPKNWFGRYIFSWPVIWVLIIGGWGILLT